MAVDFAQVTLFDNLTYNLMNQPAFWEKFSPKKLTEYIAQKLHIYVNYGVTSKLV